MDSIAEFAERGMDESDLIHVDDVSWDVQTDVLIAGGGGCGLVAALAASEARDLTVTILEKDEDVGGNTALSTGMIPAAGSRLQQAADIDEDPEDMARDILEKNDYESDEALTHRLCRQSRHLVHWLLDECGVELELVTDFKYPRQSEYRMHAPPGRHGEYLVADLLRAVEGRPNVELLTNAPVRSLVADGDAVAGVVAGEHRTETIEAAKVILATDGFGGNREMIAESIGEAASDLPHFGSPSNTGDGIRWGHALGGALSRMDAFQAHSTVMVESGMRSRYSLVMHGGILLNNAGERFGDESMGYSAFARYVLEQPERLAYKIFDQEIYDRVAGQFDDFQDHAEHYERAESIEALAETLGLDPGRTRETLATYNEAAAGERQDEHGRAERLSTLHPPFYGVAVQPALFHTQGGLAVDEHARVCRTDGSVVENLYAGGGTAVGISGHGVSGYSSGNGLTAALGLGRLAGIHARDSVTG